ncbi:Uncharacterized protein HA466_0083680 [Hirschfeldia incana]|nr:Uncharacterized protein HA466_0083680 [Hirschfeldia incana]
MDGSFPQGGVVRGGASSYGGFDLQGSMRVHQQHNNNPNSQQPLHEGLPFTMVTAQTCDHHHHNVAVTEQQHNKNSVSDDDEPSFNEEGGGEKSAKGSPWQRVKWTDKMVKLLITAVSYIGDDSSMDGGSRRKFAALQKKGKWKSVSKVMSERGYHVSPQQCEDKFNDLNKRYKKLNDMLGRGTSCQVVENPALLDSIGYLNDKEKDDVRKIMSSKHLFYEEMCSYHNGNRLHLPHDLALQRSLKLALRNRDDHDSHHQVEDLDDEDGEGEEGDEYDDFSHGGCRGVHHGSGGGGALKKARQSHSHEDVDHPGHHVSSVECNKLSLAQMPFPQGGEESERAALTQKQWIESRTLQLEEQKFQIQVELLELEKQRFRWERFSKKRDQELERMRMENERMKLENDRMGLELKQRELGVEL